MAGTSQEQSAMEALTNTLTILSMNSAANSRGSSLGGISQPAHSAGFAGESPSTSYMERHTCLRSSTSFTKKGGQELPGSPPISPNFRRNRHPFIIGVAGGTASGKTTVSRHSPSHGAGLDRSVRAIRLIMAENCCPVNSRFFDFEFPCVLFWCFSLGMHS